MTAIDDILKQFARIAQNPKKQFEEYVSGGVPVVGCAPVYAPEEIIHSMGFVPFGVWGADTQLKEAKRYFPSFICGIVQSIVELGIAGTYKGMTALIVPPLCDSLKCLGENWKYAVKDIPFIPMTYPQNRKLDAGKEFTKAGYLRVIADLEKISGKKFSEAALEKSVAVYNEHNKAMREVSKALADYPSVTPDGRSAIFKSAYFMKKEEHTALVNRFLQALKECPAKPEKKKRVVTTGILADNGSLLDILGREGFHIVADDMASESRQYRTDAVEGRDALEKMANKFAAMDNCSVLYDAEKKRARYIADMAKERKADGILVLLTKFCDPEEFDYVVLKKAFDADGIPSTVVEVDRQMENYEQARTNLQAFGEML
jgi:bcr-type benzoyl-CoA reductase subunit C